MPSRHSGFRRLTNTVAVILTPLFLLSLWSAPGNGATVEPNDCVIHKNLHEKIVEKHFIFPDPSNPPTGSRLQVGHKVWFRAEFTDQNGKWVAETKGYSYVPYRDDVKDEILQYAQETITTADGAFRTSGLYSVTPENSGQWNYMPAYGISGKYKGKRGSRTFQITELGATLNSEFFLCAGLKENWTWNPPPTGPPPSTGATPPPSVSSPPASPTPPPTGTGPSPSTGPSTGPPPVQPAVQPALGATKPVKPNHCVLFTPMIEELTQEIGPAPGEGGEWPPGVGAWLYYKSKFTKPDGGLIATARGYSYTPYKDSAADVSLKFVQQTLYFKDGAVRTTGLYNLVGSNVYEWHALYAYGISGKYKGMIGTRRFQVYDQNHLNGQVFLCSGLKEHWKWDPPAT